MIKAEGTNRRWDPSSGGPFRRDTLTALIFVGGHYPLTTNH
jgi:hypothetical protein